eukprot:299548-Pyramimonas_sp.AAC.1
MRRRTFRASTRRLLRCNSTPRAAAPALPGLPPPGSRPPRPSARAGGPARQRPPCAGLSSPTPRTDRGPRPRKT